MFSCCYLSCYSPSILSISDSVKSLFLICSNINVRPTRPVRNASVPISLSNVMSSNVFLATDNSSITLHFMITEMTEIIKGLGVYPNNMLKNLKNSKEVLNVVNTLKSAQKNMKIPMLDRILALILGVVDYTILGESPINAFAKELGGLLGFSFGTALGAPLGPGAFVTGIAGGIVGEQLGNGLSAILASIPGIKDLKDPIMRDGRPLVRNPFGKGAEEFDKAQEELSMANLAEGKSSASDTASDISSSASYEEEEDSTVIIDGGGQQSSSAPSQARKSKLINVGLSKDTIVNSQYELSNTAALSKV